MGDPKPIDLVPYDPKWPTQFEELRRALAEPLGEVAARIEHVGSTSVAGLRAKPILDIDIVLRSPADLEETIARLAVLGYQYEGDLGIAGRESFKGLDRHVPRDRSARAWPTHNLYVCAPESDTLKRHLAFRDALRASSEDVARYERLKDELALKYRNDREGYVEGKTEFVNEVLARVKVAE